LGTVMLLVVAVVVMAVDEVVEWVVAVSVVSPMTAAELFFAAVVIVVVVAVIAFLVVVVIVVDLWTWSTCGLTFSSSLLLTAALATPAVAPLSLATAALLSFIFNCNAISCNFFTSSHSFSH